MEGGNSSLGAPKTATPAMDAAKIFADKCAVCHGNDGKGKLKGTPDFTNAEWQKKETDAEFTETIKAGKKPMPPFGGKLSEEQIKSLVAYVRSLAKK
ncbi:MAG: c-type cytochrome [Acidobacteria bacterium]|nr:c-type cytochrome [Acidobacteriota bacterium]